MSEARDPRVDLAEADAVALAPHPVNDEPDARPRVEPAVHKRKLARTERKLEEAEGGGEEGVA